MHCALAPTTTFCSSPLEVIPHSPSHLVLYHLPQVQNRGQVHLLGSAHGSVPNLLSLYQEEEGCLFPHKVQNGSKPRCPPLTEHPTGPLRRRDPDRFSEVPSEGGKMKKDQKWDPQDGAIFSMFGRTEPIPSPIPRKRNHSYKFVIVQSHAWGPEDSPGCLLSASGGSEKYWGGLDRVPSGLLAGPW